MPSIRRGSDSQVRPAGRSTEPCADSLLTAWLNGDRRAGQLFVERYQCTVRAYVARRTREDVDDLVQQIFLTCLAVGTSYRGEGSARAFLLGIARNELLATWRRRARALPASADRRVDLEECQAPEQDATSTRSEDFVERALRTLPSDQSSAVRLVYWDGLTREAVAQRTQASPGTVASRLRLAKRRLRRMIESVDRSVESEGESRVSQDGDELRMKR